MKISALSLLLLSCGGSHSQASSPTTPGPAPKTQEAETSAYLKEEVSVSAEMGALNPQKTHSSFYNAMDGVQLCVTRATERLQFLSGDIELSVLVNTVGKPLRVWSEHSSLGDRKTELCIFDALSAVSWPSSVGGPVSIATNRFEFPLSKGAIAPAAWDSGRATAALEPLQESLAACRTDSSGDVLITLYVDASGMAISAGAGHNRTVSDEAIECLLGVLLAAQYPEAEPGPAKLRFHL